ncbi:MAG: 50S ribosomal protein L3 [Myxococcota bacterium]
MNTNLGLIGKKLGNTQIFSEDGEVQRVTVVEVGPCVVVGKRTPEKHGYSALRIGFGKKRTKSIRKPEAGLYAKLGLDVPKTVKELRLAADVVEGYEVGQTITAADIFSDGQFVDIQGTSKGKGYTGVMKRHNFSGYKATHGAHEYQRHGGSIGMNMTPGRVFKGKKMAGQHGNRKVTVLSVKVAKVMAEEGLVLVRGSVPGAPGSTVLVRTATKKKAAQA